MTPVSPPTSYNGVQLTLEQTKLLRDDLDRIDVLDNELKALQDMAIYRNQLAVAADNESRACNVNNNDPSGDGVAATQCRIKWDTEQANQARLRDAILNTDIPNKNQQITLAKKNYNDDLDSVQTQIKLQIQASQANNNTVTNNAAAQATVLASDPNVLINAANAKALADKTALEQATIKDKQKRDERTKIVIFVIIAGAVIVVGFYFIKKLF